MADDLLEHEEEGEEDAELHEHAMTMIVKFCALEQATRLYDLNNAIVTNTLSEMCEAARNFAKLVGEAMTLTTTGYSFFINRRLIRMDFNTYRKAEVLRRIWGRIGMGKVVLPEKVAVEDLREFTGRWLAALTDPQQTTSFFARPWAGVIARPVMGDETAGDKIRPEEYLTRTVCALLVLTRTTVSRVSEGRRPPVLRIKRALQVVVDHLEGYTNLLLALVRMRDFHNDLAGHLLSTALMALVIGHKAGLERVQLVSLAIAALFHDLPKAGLNDQTLNALEQPEKLPAANRSQIGDHWMNQLRSFMKASGISDETFVRAVVLYESQLEFTRTDLYAGEGPTLSVYSRLLRWADKMDTVAWAREGKKRRTTIEAMNEVVRHYNRDTFARLFVDTFGLFPTGSAVRLSTGELGIVIAQHYGGDATRPAVKVIADRAGNAVDGQLIDLAVERKRKVAGSVNEEALQVNPVACFGESV